MKLPESVFEEVNDYLRFIGKGKLEHDDHATLSFGEPSIVGNIPHRFYASINQKRRPLSSGVIRSVADLSIAVEPPENAHMPGWVYSLGIAPHLYVPAEVLAMPEDRYRTWNIWSLKDEAGGYVNDGILACFELIFGEIFKEAGEVIQKMHDHSFNYPV